MSFLDLPLTLAPALIGDAVADYALFFNSIRMIGTIIPGVTIEEIHDDNLTVTDHPVETGATISDHAFKPPVELMMHVGWSNSTARSEGYVQAIYQELQSLQAQRQPFNISTGKRMYQNMLMTGLQVVTDETSEYTLMSTIHFREIIIVDTSGGNQAPQSAQAQPQQTSPSTNNGIQTPQSVPTPPPRPSDVTTVPQAPGFPG